MNSTANNIKSIVNQLAFDRLEFEICTALAAHFGFTVEEALRVLGAESVGVAKERVKAVKRAPIPWLGVARGGDMCQAIENNKGLFTQCEARAAKGAEWCAKCAKNGQKYGTVADRVALGAAFVGNGRAPSSYAKVLKSSGFERADAEAEASARGVVLPDAVFEEVARPKAARKPRAAKATTAAARTAVVAAPAPAVAVERSLDEILDEDDDSAAVPAVAVPAVPEPAPVPVPAKAERKKAPEKTAEQKADIAAKTKATKEANKAAAVAAAAAEAAAALAAQPAAASAWTHKGVEYLKDSDNIVYDKATGQEIGAYNPATKEIELGDYE